MGSEGEGCFAGHQSAKEAEDSILCIRKFLGGVRFYPNMYTIMIPVVEADLMNTGAIILEVITHKDRIN